MTFSFDAIFQLLLATVALFHKGILRGLGLNPKRVRDRLGILWVIFFAFVVNYASYLVAEPFRSRPMKFFLVGLVVGIPAGILSAKDMFKNVKDNILYPQRRLLLYLSLLVSGALGGGAFYFGFVEEFLSVAAGWSTTSLGVLMLYIIRYEKSYGP